MKKIVVGVLFLLLVAGIGVGFYFMSNLDSIVAGIIESQGSKVASTEVGVSGVDISLKDGRASLAGFTVANPSGFKGDRAFSLGEVTVDLDLGSLREEPIIIDEITVREPQVLAEFLETGSLNLDVLKKSIQGYVPTTGNEGKDEGEMKRVRIKSFTFEKGRIEVDASALGVDDQSLDLPAIRLTDIGGSAGARPDEVARVVMDALTSKATAEIARAGVNQLMEKEAKGLLDKITK